MYNLSSFGLKNNTDFVSMKITVEDGKNKELIIKNIPHFDESKFYYTDNKLSYFISNKQRIIIGSYLAFKGQIEFKEQYKLKIRNFKLLIEIPNNCQYLDGSLSINNKIVSFSFINNTMIIPMKVNDIIRFCLYPTGKGIYALNSFIEFQIDDKTIIQPISSPKFEATEITYYLPKKTGNKTVSLIGSAAINSQILVFDNDVIVGQTKSNINGDWMLEFQLENPSTYSNHYIYIKSILQNGVEINSETNHLIYNSGIITVVSVTMYVNEKKIKMDYPVSKRKITYIVVSRYTHFTFQVDFSNNETERVNNVKLIIQTTGNTIVEIPGFLDEEKKVWLAEKSFSQYELPSSIQVEYQYDEIAVIPKESLDNIVNISNETINQYENNFKKLGFEIERAEDNYTDNENNNRIVIHKYRFVNDKVVISEGTSKMVQKQITKDEIEKIKENPKYIKAVDSKGKEHYVKQSIDKGIKFEHINVENGDIEVFEYDFNLPSVEVFENNFFDYLGLTTGLTFNPLNALLGMKNYLQTLKNLYKLLKDLKTNFKCIPNKHKYDAINNIFLSFVFSTANCAASFNFDAVFGDYNPFNWFIDKSVEASINTLQNDIEKIIEQHGCNKPKPTPLYSIPIEPIIDPSGYVYEAVESNRIEGVTTTIFEKVNHVINGEKHEVAEFWEADEFGQENPLLTNDLGWYQWDVPKGLWQVKYEKLSYETKYSEWLPVPPPQLDVNVPIVSYVQPEIKRLIGYTTRIEIEFTKYMLLSTLNMTNVLVTKNGNLIDGHLEFINSEIDPNQNDVNYTSFIYFVPNEIFQKNDEVVVLVKKEVKSYAGVSLNSDLNEMIKIIIEPKIILDSDVINVTYGKVKRIDYIVTIDPSDSVNNKKLILNQNSQNSVILESNSIIINNSGIAQVSLHVVFPGRAEIMMTIEGTTIKSTKTINVELPKPKLNKVTASIESNSTIDFNTPVELYSSVSGSKIYYTINNQVLKPYSGSIILINDTDLIAIAKHENYEESDIVSYHYNVIIIITIFFDPKGGIINIFSKEVMKNKPFGDLPIPVKENYEFDGWFSDLSWNNKITNETIVSVSENMTLYAKWVNNDEIIEVIATDPVSSIQTNKINENTIKSSESKNKIMIIGISIGCAIVVVIVIVIAILIVASKRKRIRVQNFESENEDMQSNP